MKAGVIFRWWSFWIGFHYSKFNKRLCLNILPCLTFWITLPGGVKPEIKNM